MEQASTYIFLKILKLVRRVAVFSTCIHYNCMCQFVALLIVVVAFAGIAVCLIIICCGIHCLRRYVDHSVVTLTREEHRPTLSAIGETLLFILVNSYHTKLDIGVRCSNYLCACHEMLNEHCDCKYVLSLIIFTVGPINQRMKV